MAKLRRVKVGQTQVLYQCKINIPNSHLKSIKLGFFITKNEIHSIEQNLIFSHTGAVPMALLTLIIILALTSPY